MCVYDVCVWCVMCIAELQEVIYTQRWIVCVLWYRSYARNALYMRCVLCTWCVMCVRAWCALQSSRRSYTPYLSLMYTQYISLHTTLHTTHKQYISLLTTHKLPKWTVCVLSYLLFVQIFLCVRYVSCTWCVMCVCDVCVWCVCNVHCRAAGSHTRRARDG